MRSCVDTSVVSPQSRSTHEVYASTLSRWGTCCPNDYVWRYLPFLFDSCQIPLICHSIPILFLFHILLGRVINLVNMYIYTMIRAKSKLYLSSKKKNYGLSLLNTLNEMDSCSCKINQMLIYLVSNSFKTFVVKIKPYSNLIQICP